MKIGAVSRAFALLFIALATTSCAMPQRMPAETYAITVVDLESGTPVPGAKVTFGYSGVRDGRRAAEGITDADGKWTFSVPAVSLPMHMGDMYFAGGYLRSFTVVADGYAGITATEGPSGFGSSPRLKIRQIRNRFGAVRVVAVGPLDAERELVTFDVLDGPRAGTQMVLPIRNWYAEDYAIGTKYYLEQAVERYEREYAGFPKASFAPHLSFRKVTRDEPYAP